MYILITYDVNTETKEGRRRLYKVARLCKDYGQRVQHSVFECVLTDVQLVQLMEKLKHNMDTSLDNIRIYYLNRSENRRIITLGRKTSIDVEGTLII